MLTDTHCHLDAAEFDADRDAVLARAYATGVSRIVVPSVERANFGAVASLCRAEPACVAAYGIHPMYVGRARQDDLVALRNMLETGNAVAVGEIGLDHFVAERDESLQAHFFVEQLKIAREFDLPVLLHVRRAIDAVLGKLRRFPVRGGIAHAFNGSRQQAEAFIDLGFKLGFGGAMTWTRALRIRELAATLPLEAIVLETDAPDIPPQWLGKGRNEPAEMAGILQAFSVLRGISEADAETAIQGNVRSALPALQSG